MSDVSDDYDEDEAVQLGVCSVLFLKHAFFARYYVLDNRVRGPDCISLFGKA